MTTYKTLRYGASGDDVRQLQERLNQNGASLEIDGIYGRDTEAAVKKYQQDNQLSVDGIAGDETWGSLTKSQSTAAPEVETAPETPAQTTYTPSESVLQAEQALQQQLGTKPGSYTSAWQDDLNETTEAILNREDFQYDLNGDPLYQQMVAQYVNGGKMAMMDTMGQAAALTGGYGNSYAQTAGQQAYQEYLKGLNDKVPELYQLAMARYQMEGDQLQEKLGVLQQREDADYSRWQDTVNAWLGERDYVTGRYDSERDYDYGKWADERNFDYQKGRDEVADQQWQAEFDEAKRQYDQQYELSSSKKSGGSGGYRYVYGDKVDGKDEYEISESDQNAAAKWLRKAEANYGGRETSMYGPYNPEKVIKIGYDNGELSIGQVAYLLERYT